MAPRIQNFVVDIMYLSNYYVALELLTTTYDYDYCAELPKTNIYCLYNFL